MTVEELIERQEFLSLELGSIDVASPGSCGLTYFASSEWEDARRGDTFAIAVSGAVDWGFRGTLRGMWNFGVADHPALLPWAFERAELYVGHAVEEPQQVADVLVREVARIGRDFVLPHDVLNQEMDLAALLAGGHGLVAKGPTPILEALEIALDRSGGLPTVIDRHRPRGATDARDQMHMVGLVCLELEGAWVVGEEFVVSGDAVEWMRRLS